VGLQMWVRLVLVPHICRSLQMWVGRVVFIRKKLRPVCPLVEVPIRPE